MNGFFNSHPILANIIAGLILSGILYLLNLLIKTINKKNFVFIIGNWYGYYLSKNEDFAIKQEIKITYNFLHRLKIFIEEETSANYIFKGNLEILEGHLYGYLEGINHIEKSFLVMMLPFNRKDTIPSLNGIFFGSKSR